MLNDEQIELLGRVLAGDVGEDAPEVRSLLDGMAEAREWLERSRAIEVRLSAAGEEARADIREALAMRGAPGESAVERVVQGGAAPEPRGMSGGWLRWAAAALVIAALGIATWMYGGEESEPPRLLGDAVELEAPAGEVDAYGTFRWSWERPVGGYEIVVVYDAESGDELARSGEREDGEWTPGAERASSWPERIEWEVRVFDATGALVRTSARAEARRAAR